MQRILFASVLMSFVFLSTVSFAQSDGLAAPIAEGYFVPQMSPTNGILIEFEGPAPSPNVLNFEGVSIEGTWTQPYPNLELFKPAEPLADGIYTLNSEVSQALSTTETTVIEDDITYNQLPFTVTFGGYFQVQSCCDDVCEEADPLDCCWNGAAQSSVNGNVTFEENATAHIVEVSEIQSARPANGEDAAAALPYYARVQNRGIFIPLSGEPGQEKCVSISATDFDGTSIFSETQCATIETEEEPPAAEEVPDACDGTNVNEPNPNPVNPSGSGDKADASCSQTNASSAPLWLVLLGLMAFRRRRS